MSVSYQPESSDGALRVLVVEDETLLAMLMEDMVLELGHKVVGPVEGLGHAMDIARGSQAVDCAILDVNFEGRETYPLADVLAERRIPFIFATGHGRDGLSERFRDAPLLQKPFQLGELRAAFAGLSPPKAA